LVTVVSRVIYEPINRWHFLRDISARTPHFKDVIHVLPNDLWIIMVRIKRAENG
jgi:hypothetical protein